MSPRAAAPLAALLVLITATLGTAAPLHKTFEEDFEAVDDWQLANALQDCVLGDRTGCALRVGVTPGASTATYSRPVAGIQDARVGAAYAGFATEITAKVRMTGNLTSSALALQLEDGTVVEVRMLNFQSGVTLRVGSASTSSSIALTHGLWYDVKLTLNTNGATMTISNDKSATLGPVPLPPRAGAITSIKVTGSTTVANAPHHWDELVMGPILVDAPQIPPLP